MAFRGLDRFTESCASIHRKVSILLFIVFVAFLICLLIVAENYIFKIILFIYSLICSSLIIYLVEFVFLKKNYSIGPVNEDLSNKTVAVAVTYRDQEHDIIRKTCELVGKIRGVSRFYLVDNSTKKENFEYADELCHRLNFEHVPAPQKKKISWKAEPLNHFLFNNLEEDYVVLVDKDEIITDDGLVVENLPYMQRDVAYVQTMKMEKGNTLFNKALADYNNFFYQIIQPVDGSHGAAIFGGSMALMDVKKLKEVGGFETILEDVNISFKFFDRGYKGLFNPKAYSEAGESDLNYDYFIKRHYRYAYGTTYLFIDYLNRIKKIPPNLYLHMRYLFNLLSTQFLSSFLFLVSLCVLIMTTYAHSGFIDILAGGLILVSPLIILIILSIFTKGNILIGLFTFMINQSIMFVRFRGTFSALKGVAVPWNVKCKKSIELAWLIFGTITLIALTATHSYMSLRIIYGVFWILYVAPVIIYLKEN